MTNNGAPSALNGFDEEEIPFSDDELAASSIDVEPTPEQVLWHGIVRQYGDADTSGKHAAVRILDELLAGRTPSDYDRATARMGLGADGTPLPEPVQSPRRMRDVIMNEWRTPLIRHGNSVAWYDAGRHCYRAWEKNDDFDVAIIERSDVGNRRAFEDSLRRELAAYAFEPDEPDLLHNPS